MLTVLLPRMSSREVKLHVRTRSEFVEAIMVPNPQGRGLVYVFDRNGVDQRCWGTLRGNVLDVARPRRRSPGNSPIAPKATTTVPAHPGKAGEQTGSTRPLPTALNRSGPHLPAPNGTRRPAGPRVDAGQRGAASAFTPKRSTALNSISSRLSSLVAAPGRRDRQPLEMTRGEQTGSMGLTSSALPKRSR